MCQINDPKFHTCYGCGRLDCECPADRCTRGGPVHDFKLRVSSRTDRCRWCGEVKVSGD